LARHVACVGFISGGRLHVEPDEQTEPKLGPAAAGGLTEGFAASPSHGLELLASGFLHEPLPPTFVFWRGLSQRFFSALCHTSNLDGPSKVTIPKPTVSEWAAFAEAAPPMKGLEYLNEQVLVRVWDELEAHVCAAIARNPGGVTAYLKSCNAAWHAIGRVTFHLAENKRTPSYPFAFLATYTHRLPNRAKFSTCRSARPGRVCRDKESCGTGDPAFASATCGGTEQAGA
jgi:non-specific serine/threonine protein kinase